MQLCNDSSIKNSMYTPCNLNFNRFQRKILSVTVLTLHIRRSLLFKRSIRQKLERIITLGRDIINRFLDRLPRTRFIYRKPLVHVVYLVLRQSIVRTFVFWTYKLRLVKWLSILKLSNFFGYYFRWSHRRALFQILVCTTCFEVYFEYRLVFVAQ